MLTDALKYLFSQAETKYMGPFNGRDFTTAPLYKVPQEKVDPLQVYTLDALLHYLGNNKDDLDMSDLIIHIESPTKVTLMDHLDSTDRNRQTYVVASYSPPTHSFGRYIDLDTFVPYLKACYQPTEDRDILMSALGNIVDEESVTTEDDGVSQSVATKSGVRLVGTTQLPNPVYLRPFCTFPEIDAQPERPFVFRLAPNGKAACLLEADGGAWQGDAICKIRDYLDGALNDLPEVKFEVGIIA